MDLSETDDTVFVSFLMVVVVSGVQSFMIVFALVNAAVKTCSN